MIVVQKVLGLSSWTPKEKNVKRKKNKNKQNSL